MKYLISFLLLLILSASSCKKNKTGEQLPPETQEGKFTIGFKVDGKVYTAKGKGGLLSSESVTYGLLADDNSINIFASNSSASKPKFHLTLIVHYKGAQGIYEMKNYPYQGTFMDGQDGTIPGSNNVFKTSETYNGKVNINFFNGSLPALNGTILSGTFEMDAVNGEGKVIHITDGRFDIGH